MTGRSPGSRIIVIATFPIRTICTNQWLSSNRSSITVAGPRRILTDLPY